MRIYVPATPADLVARTALAARGAHAVTPGLRAALPDEDDEGLEFSAQLAAADASLGLLAATGTGLRRVVLSVDVADAAVPGDAGDESDPTLVRPARSVRRQDIVCVHLDGPEAREDVAAALGGDVAAAERLAERDLLWYDVTELDALADELRAELPEA